MTSDSVRYAESSGKTEILRLVAGGSEAAFPLHDVILTATASLPSPLPLAAPPLEGMVAIDGNPVIRIDLAQLLTGQPGAGRTVAVVRLEGRTVALRVDHITLEKGVPSLPHELTALLRTFTPSSVASGAKGAASPRIVPVQLMLLRDRGVTIGVPAAAIERIDRITARHDLLTESGNPLTLVRVNEELFPAYPLPSRMAGVMEGTSSWGLIVTPGSARVVWTAAEVLGLHAAVPERIRSLAIPDEQPLLWYETESGDIVEIIDPDGRMDVRSTPPPSVRKSVAERRGDLYLRCGPFCCLLSLGMVGFVPETMTGLTAKPSASGDLPVIDLARLLGFTGERSPCRGVLLIGGTGARQVVAVDEIRDAALMRVGNLLPLPAVPAAVARLCDGVVLDEKTGEWVYSLHGLLDGPAIESALMGWLPVVEIEGTTPALPS